MIISSNDIRLACDFVNSYYDDNDGYCDIVLDLTDGSVLAYHHFSLYDVRYYNPYRYIVQGGFLPNGRKAVPEDVLHRFRFAVDNRR